MPHCQEERVFFEVVILLRGEIKTHPTFFSKVQIGNVINCHISYDDCRLKNTDLWLWGRNGLSANLWITVHLL